MVRGLREQGIRPATVLDVGANKGQFTVAMCELLGPVHVHSFEPLPDMSVKLSRACARYPYVDVYRLALGSAPGRATFHVNAHSQASSLLNIGQRHRAAFPDAVPTSTVDVEVARLDDVVEPTSLASPALLKIDTQGYETEVLDGASRSLEHIEWLIAELSFLPLYEGERSFLEVLEILRVRGFRFERPVGALKHPATGEYLQIDSLFRRLP